LYKTIFQSRKKSAEKFTEWVTSEVLPTIRKTGGYRKPMSTAEQIKLLALGNTELNERVSDVEKKIDSLENDMPLYGCEIDDAHDLISNYEVPKVLKEQITDANAQIRIL
jgi:prophage antirepressor-like protein